MKFKTCLHCGYDSIHCKCGKERNTTGDVEEFQNYHNYDNEQDYSRTAPMIPRSKEAHILEELKPVENEELITWIQRTNLGINKSSEHGIYHHIFGTRKTWPCHTTNRYCIVCLPNQYINMQRRALLAIANKIDLKKFRYNQDSDTFETK